MPLSLHFYDYEQSNAPPSTQLHHVMLLCSLVSTMGWCCLCGDHVGYQHSWVCAFTYAGWWVGGSQHCVFAILRSKRNNCCIEKVGGAKYIWFYWHNMELGLVYVCGQKVIPWCEPKMVPTCILNPFYLLKCRLLQFFNYSKCIKRVKGEVGLRVLI